MHRGIGDFDDLKTKNISPELSDFNVDLELFHITKENQNTLKERDFSYSVTANGYPKVKNKRTPVEYEMHVRPGVLPRIQIRATMSGTHEEIYATINLDTPVFFGETRTLLLRKEDINFDYLYYDPEDVEEYIMIGRFGQGNYVEYTFENGTSNATELQDIYVKNSYEQIIPIRSIGDIQTGLMSWNLLYSVPSFRDSLIQLKIENTDGNPDTYVRILGDNRTDQTVLNLDSVDSIIEIYSPQKLESSPVQEISNGSGVLRLNNTRDALIRCPIILNLDEVETSWHDISIEIQGWDSSYILQWDDPTNSSISNGFATTSNPKNILYVTSNRMEQTLERVFTRVYQSTTLFDKGVLQNDFVYLSVDNPTVLELWGNDRNYDHVIASVSTDVPFVGLNVNSIYLNHEDNDRKLVVELKRNLRGESSCLWEPTITRGFYYDGEFRRFLSDNLIYESSLPDTNKILLKNPIEENTPVMVFKEGHGWLSLSEYSVNIEANTVELVDFDIAEELEYSVSYCKKGVRSDVTIPINLNPMSVTNIQGHSVTVGLTKE